MRRLKIKSSKTALLTVTRSPQWTKRMVYILALAHNKFHKYKNGRSRIVYIGTTKKGASRPAASAVNKASQAFGKLHGVKTIEVHIATCPPRKAMQTWKYLEASLLDAFRKDILTYRTTTRCDPNRKTVCSGRRALQKS